MKSAPGHARPPSESEGSGVFKASSDGPALAYQAALNGLQYEYGRGTVSCRVCLGPAFSSHSGRIHGGLIATLFDEVTGHVAYRTSGVPMVTTLLRVRFVEPMLPEVEYRIDVNVGAEVGGVLDVTAELLGARLVAAASAKFRPLFRGQSIDHALAHAEEKS